MRWPGTVLAALWLALFASMAASWWHLATLFGRFEAAGQEWVGAIAATAVDLGIIASLLALGELRSKGQSTARAKGTVAGLVLLSMVANAMHAQVYGRAGTGWEWWLSIVVAAALPLIVLGLTVLLDDLKQPVVVSESGALAVATAPAGGARPARVSPDVAAIQLLEKEPSLSAAQISRRLNNKPHHTKVKRLAEANGWRWHDLTHAWVPTDIPVVE